MSIIICLCAGHSVSKFFVHVTQHMTLATRHSIYSQRGKIAGSNSMGWYFHEGNL
eukprot:m.1643611 g.1643611  ORF g.1643611 m.1643611 type:complete len:55 (+) comp59346_c0_seq1:196-360(+)